MPTDAIAPQPRVRLGVVVDGPAIARWMDRLLAAIRASPLAELVAVTVDPAPARRRVGARARLGRPHHTGVHTFNRQGDVTVLDCKLRVPR